MHNFALQFPLKLKHKLSTRATSVDSDYENAQHQFVYKDDAGILLEERNKASLEIHDLRLCRFSRQCTCLFRGVELCFPTPNKHFPFCWHAHFSWFFHFVRMPTFWTEEELTQDWEFIFSLLKAGFQHGMFAYKKKKEICCSKTRRCC